MTTHNDLNLKFDFSGMSKGRLKAFNLLLDEFDRIEAEQSGPRLLEEDELEMLNAAGVPGLDFSKRDGRR